MLFVMWLAWCVSVVGTPNYDDVDARHEARMVNETRVEEGPARAAQRALQERLRAL
jgi:hypothetical protein